MSVYKNPGDAMDFTAPTGGVVAGTFYLIGAVLLMAGTTVAAGERFAGTVKGVFNEVPAATSQAWAEGVKIYWDNTNSVFTTTAAGNTLIGYAAGAKIASAATGSVKLTGA